MTDQTTHPEPPQYVDPLDMAQNCVSAVQRTAEFQDRDPLAARAANAGQAAWQSAQLGACMALVSLAGDVRRLADQIAPQPEAHRIRVTRPPAG